VLTRLDPVSYGVDAIRRIVLSQVGLPPATLDQLGISVFGSPLSIASDLAVLAVFATVVLALAISAFNTTE
jgi:ABC-2 type transport system permease protein